LDRRLGGPQNPLGRGGEEKNSQPPPGIEPQNPASEVVWDKIASDKVRYVRIV
jgi:hypothetical protein